FLTLIFAFNILDWFILVSFFDCAFYCLFFRFRYLICIIHFDFFSFPTRRSSDLLLCYYIALYFACTVIIEGYSCLTLIVDFNSLDWGIWVSFFDCAFYCLFFRFR